MTRHGTAAGSTLRHRIPAIAWLAMMLLVPAAAGPGAAAPISGVGGFDYYAGALGQTTKGLVGALVLGLGGGDLTLAGVRYDDSHIGQGFSLTGGAGVPVAPALMLRVAGTRFIGEASFRAWRAKVGPQFTLPGGRTLTLSYAHYRDDLAVRSNGAIAEATTPLVARLDGKAGASYATAPQGPAALQGSVGLGWSVVRNLELSGEVGLSRNAAGAAGQPFPGSGPLDALPLLGGGSPSASGAPESTREVDATLLVGVRVMLP